jgi:hypothetical protein
MLPATLVFQGGDRLCLLQIGLFSRVEVTHVSPQRKACMLETAAFSTLFFVTIELVFERIISCNVGVSRCR